MPDEHDFSHSNGHLHGTAASGADLAEMLPPDLEPIHERLTHDSDGWTRRLPEAESLATYARSLALGATPATPIPEPHGEPDGRDGLVTDMPVAESSTFPHELSTRAPAHRPEPRRALVALVAAVAVVALMAAVLTSLAPGRSPSAGKSTATTVPTSTTIPTATPRPAYGPITGNWQPAPYLQSQPDQPEIAPSNPNVVYEAVFTQTNGAEPVGQYSTLRRSDNSGQTWRALSVPKPSDPVVTAWGPAGVLVSPSDPNMVILSLTSQLSYTTPAECPADQRTAETTQHGGVLADGFVRCSVLYVSKDGGGSWTPIIVGGIGSLPTNGFDALYAQNGRFYATFDAGTQPSDAFSYRVVTSTDGVRWSLVDAEPLGAAKGNRICGFVAVPAGTTVFAKTDTSSCTDYKGPEPHLFRSDDAGLHWRDLGPLPYHFTRLMAAEQGAADAQPTLYLWTANGFGQTVSGVTDQTVQVSTDGVIWQTAPAAGIPSGYQPYGPVAGTLSDGSVVMMYVAGSSGGAGLHDLITVGFFAWHAGDSTWHQVAPPLTVADRSNFSGGWDHFFVTPTAGVHGTVWHIHFDAGSLTHPRTYSVERYSS